MNSYTIIQNHASIVTCSAKWHKDVVIAARMAEQSARPGSVLDLCVAATTRQFVWRRTTE